MTEWPRVTPLEEPWRQFQSIETRGDVRNDPEDQPESRPRLADKHGDIFAREAEGGHAEEVEEPVDHESGMTEVVGVVGDVGEGPLGLAGWGLAGKWDLERQGYQAVRQAEEEVGCDGGRCSATG